MGTFWPNPKWQAATAYLAGAVVSPTTTDATVWRCTTAGTSGNSEPSWPVAPVTAPPYTVTDGTVTWTLGTRFRQDVNDALAAVLTSFQSANPGLLRHVYTERPGSFATGELPCAWVDAEPETISYTAGTRTRTIGATVGIADASPEAEEFSDRINFLVDALVDAYTAAYAQAGPGSLLQLSAVQDVDIPEGAVHLSGVQLVFAPTFKTEGRQ